MNLRNLALATAAMACLALTSFAQITTLEGDVLGADGKPVQNAEIQITRTDIKGNYKTKTNKKGHYIYMGLPIGDYSVVVVLEGKPADQPQKVHTSPGDAKNISFDLRAAAAERATQQAAMEPIGRRTVHESEAARVLPAPPS